MFRLVRNEKVDQNLLFWPDQVWKSRFMSKYNLRYEKTTATSFSKRAYKSQLYSALLFNRMLRHIFQMPDGEGRIRNLDEYVLHVQLSTEELDCVVFDSYLKLQFKLKKKCEISLDPPPPLEKSKII